jgi:formate hydrogenlyase subunit 6/NADH:ubiquinone oxidoreductase subunit I
MSLLNKLISRLKFILTQKISTVEFPYVVKHAPQHARVSLRNNFAECIGCHKCEEVCPVQCIDILSEEFTPDTKIPKSSKGIIFERRVTSFKIDFTTCVNCGVCVDVCPTTSLTYDKNFVAPRQDSRHLVMDLVHRPRTLRREQGYEE